MEEEEGTHEVYRMGTSFVAPGEAKTRLPPPVELSPSIVNICKAYSGLTDDTEMFDDDEDADYKIHDDEEEDDDEEEEEDFEDEAEEAVTEGLQIIDTDMGSFFEPMRKFLSKVMRTLMRHDPLD
ncbi:hypothetical protein PVAP13_1NG318400 [Panicum virgatum]|uniref:Uncharacterized protein n=1 Tax=Panicum virgatum TaxID=38727 RepID=A0A8T0WX60_PANVG|nr:hypothetical protein PVAP13_1NG318400 [Panicum virgatum]